MGKREIGRIDQDEIGKIDEDERGNEKRRRGER
jgi:hypothetical protein